MLPLDSFVESLHHGMEVHLDELDLLGMETDHNLAGGKVHVPVQDQLMDVVEGQVVQKCVLGLGREKNLDLDRELILDFD